MAGAPQETLATLGEVLLTPTRIYAPAVLATRAALVAAGLDIHGLAHITGGGLPGNVPRALPDHLGARLDPDRWAMPSVIRLFGALGGMDDGELRATFNGGLGIVAVVPRETVGTATAAFAERGHEAVVVGEVVEVQSLGGARYVEGALESIA
jgi:phosphoribosylformylglycinamidine cyclo-ligase